MSARAIQIPIEHKHVEAISAFHHPAQSAPAQAGLERCSVLLAHGAGADMDSPFMVAIAEGLAARGLPVLRFNYPYMERARLEDRRLPPDRAPTLEATHRLALAQLRELEPKRRVLFSGKSMGGRMGSHLAAQGEDCAGLVFYGYPLHPPGKPERLRSEHFPAIANPALFLSGSRDALCQLDLLEEALQRFGGNPEVCVIEGADHDFRVKKSAGISREEMLERLVEETDRWERETFPL